MRCEHATKKEGEEAAREREKAAGEIEGEAAVSEQQQKQELVMKRKR